MDVIEAILKRRSIRKYNDIPVPKDALMDMAIAAQYAPCSGNAHTCRIIILDEEHIKDSIADACYNQTWMKSAPIHIVIVSDVGRLTKMYHSKGEIYAHQNAAAMTENMLICATSHGLDTCWVGAFDEQKVSNILGIPDNMNPEVIITLGYGDEKVPIPVKQSMEELVYLNGWGHLNNVPFLMKDYADVWQYHAKRFGKSVKTSSKKIHEKLKDNLKQYFDKKK